MQKETCKCSCGHVEFEVIGAPLTRIFCHCTICQDFNGSAYADVAFYNMDSITPPTEGIVDYKSYKSKSPVLRGKCSQCGDPILEKTVSGPKFWMVPTSAFTSLAELPKPTAHIYYGSRTGDVVDDIPKHKGALTSNLALAKQILSAKLFKRGA